MSAFFERITVFCFAASYGLALALEFWHYVRPRPVLRLTGIGFGAAGLLAHTFYILVQPLSLALPLGSLLFLAWILAIFYLYGSIHHYRQAWGLFVLPLVLGLIVLADILPGERSGHQTFWKAFTGPNFWGWIHGMLLLLAGVGISVAFLASIMYLVQVRRLQAKLAPDQGMRMMSLERLESMNRKAILWAFPLLTLGLIVGIALQLLQGQFWADLDSPKILSTLGLWVVFAILLYVRYGAHARGRQMAFMSLLAFAIMICALVAVHPFAAGGGGP